MTTPSPSPIGCWSYSSSPPTFTLTACSRCLCTAEVDDCSRKDFLGQSCGKCLTDEAAIGDGKKDCVHGVDEATDAIRFKNV